MATIVGRGAMPMAEEEEEEAEAATAVRAFFYGFILWK
jgi:hypothetical protein